MLNINVILIILTILLSSPYQEIAQARSIKFRNCSSNFNPKYLSNFTIYALNDTLNCESDLLVPLTSGLKAKMQIQIRLENSKKYQTLFGYTFDICNVVISYKDTMFKKWFKSLLKKSNFMQNCPIYEGHYYLHSWRMESILIPKYLYAGDYRFLANAFMLKPKHKEQDFVLDVTVDAIVVDD